MDPAQIAEMKEYLELRGMSDSLKDLVDGPFKPKPRPWKTGFPGSRYSDGSFPKFSLLWFVRSQFRSVAASAWLTISSARIPCASPMSWSICLSATMYHRIVSSLLSLWSTPAFSRCSLATFVSALATNPAGTAMIAIPMSAMTAVNALPPKVTGQISP